MASRQAHEEEVLTSISYMEGLIHAQIGEYPKALPNIKQCIKCVYDTGQENADIVICKYDTRTNCCM